MDITFGSKKPPEGEKAEKQKKPAGGGFSGLFGQKSEGFSVPQDIIDSISTIARRLKLLEEHFTVLRRKSDVSERNLMSRAKAFSKEFKAVNSELSELRHSINKIEDRILLITKEFQLTAKKEEHEVLRKYVEMWAPIKFVTRNEVERIIEDILDDRESGKSSKDL